jgi:hypothetical protein
LLLLLRLCRTFAAGCTGARSAATPAPAATRRALALRLWRLRLLRLLLLLLLLLRTLRTSGALIASALARRPLSRRTPLFLALFLPRPLLELLHLPLHELALLGVLPGPQFVVAAVGAALPPFRIAFFARGANDGFRQRHRKSARIVHFRAVPTDDRRRATLRTLIELAEGSSPQDCWDDQRAEELLRSQSTPEELRELGMSEQMIERIFAEKR